MPERQCLSCGMTVSVPQYNEDAPSQICPKCDSDIFSQTDGSCLTEDISHHRESIPEALRKLDRLLGEAYFGYYQFLRLVVGGGQIREEVQNQLYSLEQEGRIISYTEDAQNKGVILVRIREK